MKPRHDIYSSITAQLVAAIEAGAGEWRMPWLSIGVQTGPPIGAQKGPPYAMAQG